MTLRFWRRKLLISFLLFVLILVLYLNQKRFDSNLSQTSDGLSIESRSLSPNSVVLLSKLSTIDPNLIDIDVEGVYDKKLIELSELKKCDLCLGVQFCQTFITNLLVINTPFILNDISYRKAVIKNTKEKLTLMSQSSDKWSQLETMICRNASEQRLSTCDLSKAVQNSFVAKSNLFLIENYREFYRQFKRTNYANNDKSNDYFLQTTFSQCATKKYLQLLQNSFDTNNDRLMDLSEQSHLFSSLIAFPGYAVYRMIQKSESDISVLNIKGVCGRVIAFEGNYQTLELFIKDQNSFEVMAGLAVQIIQLIDDLQEEDPNWYYLQTELTFESLLVSSEGQVFLSDLNPMVVIDKSLFDEQSLRAHQSLLNSQVCNEPCFETFHQKFVKAFNTSASEPSSECAHIQRYYGQHMYAMICRNIFSSLEPNDENNLKQMSSRSGLLKLVPNKDKENVDDLLRECIYETSPGGRKQAVDELRDLLKSYLHFDETVDQNNNNANEDDEDNDVDNENNGSNNDNN